VNKRVSLIVLGVCLPLAALAARPVKPSKATKPAKPPATVEPKLLAPDALDKLKGELQGGDDAVALQAAKQLGDSGMANAADPLIETLTVGTVPTRGVAILDAMIKLGDPRGLDILELYSAHRNPELRRRGVIALGTLKDGRVVSTLLARLGDAAPDVRAAAAEALASRKEHKATERLLMLVKRNDLGAAAPLGILVSPEAIPQLAELHGTVDDNVLATALGEFIRRDDVADKLRVDVIRTLAKLPGASATTALVEYLAAVPAKDERPSKKEAQKLIDDRSKDK
jgi:HEAT repeat protein